MSSLRPFNTSNKAPNSAMLKGFNTDKSVTRQLEIDSRRMEEKLNQLKVTMNREKQERQASGRDTIWASGKPNGFLTTPSSDISKKTKPGAPRTTKPADKNKVRRIKVLKDVPLDVPERPKVNSLSSGDSVPTRRVIKGPVCGQCESKPVSLTCMECGENYCTACFARFHLKGALRNHRSVPYQQSSNNTTRSSQWDDANNNTKDVMAKRPETPKSSRGSTSNHSSGGREKVVIVKSQQDTPHSGGSLLDGEYNEEESAASFAAALAKWRNSLKQERVETVTKDENKPTVHDMGVGDTSIASMTNQKRIEIKFSDSSLSYADKLLLKQHHKSPRITPSPSTNGWNSNDLRHAAVTPSVGIPSNDEDVLELDADMRDEHERCVGIFSRNREEEHWMERPSSQLVITEIKDEPIGGDLEVASVYSVEETQPELNMPQHSSRCQVVPVTGTEVLGQETATRDVTMMGNSPHVDSDNRQKTSLAMNDARFKMDMKVTEEYERHSNSKSAAGYGGSKNKDRSETSSLQSIKQVPGRVISSKKGSARGTSRGQSRGPLGDQKGVFSSARKGPSIDWSNPSQPPRIGTHSEKATPRSMTEKSGNGQGAHAKALSSSKDENRKSLVQNSSKESTSAPTHFDQSSRGSARAQKGIMMGLTKTPSEDLMRVSKHKGYGQHSYTQGLGGFFMVGVMEVEEHGDVRPQTQTASEEGTYQGPGVWRPSSSLSDHRATTVHMPSPPKQSKENGGGSASLRRKKSATKKVVDDNTISWVLSQQPPPPGMEVKPHPLGAGGYHGNSYASGRSSANRSDSRIEIEGDDYSRFDEDNGMEGQDAADKETLDELTWELASQSGRTSADGRMTSVSLQEVDPYMENAQFASSLDEELGIRLDDGRGSGLSSPDQELTLEAISCEDLLETQRDKQAVQELDDFI